MTRWMLLVPVLSPNVGFRTGSSRILQRPWRVSELERGRYCPVSKTFGVHRIVKQSSFCMHAYTAQNCETELFLYACLYSTELWNRALFVCMPIQHRTVKQSFFLYACLYSTGLWNRAFFVCMPIQHRTVKQSFFCMHAYTAQNCETELFLYACLYSTELWNRAFFVCMPIQHRIKWCRETMVCVLYLPLIYCAVFSRC